MDHGGEAARPTMVGSADLGTAGAVQGGEAHMSTGTFHGQLGAAAARRAGFHELVRHVHATVGRAEVPVAVFHHEPGPGVAYANIVASWRQPGPVDVVLVGPQHPDGVIPVHDNYGYYSVLQPRPGAGLGVVLADLLPSGGGAVYSGDYALQSRSGAGHGEVLVNLLPDDAGHGEAFVGQLPGGVGVVFVNSGNFAHQALPAPGTRGTDGIAGALRDPNLGAGHDNSGVVGEHLRRLLPFVGIGACSVAVNGLAAGPGSPAVAFHLFVLLLGGLFLVILHVLRV